MRGRFEKYVVIIMLNKYTLLRGRGSSTTIISEYSLSLLTLPLVLSQAFLSHKQHRSLSVSSYLTVGSRLFLNYI